jgi:ABC-type glycerol-3-phosphate transport system substrate-binding protein
MRLALALAAVALLAGCGSSSAPKDDPGAFAVNVVKLITGNS